MATEKSKTENVETAKKPAAKKSTIKKSTVKTAATKTKKEAVEPKQLTPEESVIIVACMNTDFLEKLDKLAKSEGLKIVLTNEQVITDYVASQAEEIDEAARMTAFLKDDKNRRIAQEHAKEIYRIISNDKPLEKSKDMEFKIKDIVKNTTLSWSKANEMLNTLEAFGFIHRKGKDGLIFDFDLKTIREHIYSQVTFSVESLNYDIQRYMGAVAESSDISDEDKEAFISKFKDEVVKNIVF